MRCRQVRWRSVVGDAGGFYGLFRIPMANSAQLHYSDLRSRFRLSERSHPS